MKKIRMQVDPAAARYMQQEVRREWSEACTCKIADPAEECYRGKIMYVFETAEESGTAFGHGTARVHTKCARPVYVDEQQYKAEIKAGILIPSQWEFFNR